MRFSERKGAEMARNVREKYPTNLREIDAYQYPMEPFRPVLLNAYFRLTYTCGLRPNEGRTLKKQDVDLRTGEVRILNTKMQKSRVVVMSNDMLSMAKTYATLRDVACPIGCMENRQTAEPEQHNEIPKVS